MEIGTEKKISMATEKTKIFFSLKKKKWTTKSAEYLSIERELI